MAHADEGNGSTELPGVSSVIEGIAEYTLENGLRVLLFPDESQSIVTVNMTVFVGSRHEGCGEAGMAHLLEHMLFKGTPSNEEIPADLKARGANYNGTTWLDRTNYYETLPAGDAQQADDNLHYAIRMEADRLINSKILETDLQSEMTVVRNEFERGENSPQRILMQRVQAAAYEWHNYGRVTIGNLSDIERMPVNRLRDFYRKHYRPDNVMLVVAGKFDSPQALKYIQEYFGALSQPAQLLDRTYTSEPAQDGERQVTLRRVGNTQLLHVAYHIPSGANREYAAIELLASIMGAEPSGRLYGALIEPKLASTMFAFPFALHDPGLIMFGAQVPVGEPLDAAQAQLLATLENVSEEPITEVEVRRARNQFMKERRLRASNTTQLAIELSEWAAQGDWRLYFLFRDYIEGVTAEDCNNAANRFLTRNNRTLGRFIPSDSSQRVEIPAKPDLEELLADYTGREGIEQGESFDAEPQAIETRTIRGQLSCGLKTVLLPKKTRGGSVHFRIALRYGDESSLARYVHACDFLPLLLLRGTESLDYQQLQDREDELQADIRASGQTGLLILTVQTRRERLAEVLDLVGEVLTKPSLDASEFELMKRQQLAAIDAQKTEPGVLARVQLQRLLIPHPADNIRYIPTLEEMSSRIAEVSIEQIRELYASQLSGKHGEVTFVGDFDPDEVIGACEEIFGNWMPQTPFARIATDASQDVTACQVSIETPDKSNAVYFAGQAFGMRDDAEDYPALRVANFVLGGGAMSSRLGKRLRQDEGLSYSVGSRFYAHPIDSHATLTIQAIANPSMRQRVIDAIVEELQQMIEAGITDEELENAKKSILQSEQVTRTQDSTLVGILGNSAFSGRDMHFSAKQDAAISQLKIAQVNQAIKRHISLSRMVTVTAGDFAGAQVPPLTAKAP
ncbi:MAG TPA: insulinase family protein [Planctomycetaceae bacterium]|nr:insulinase family protein [Planctomycetaceae bacterium]